MFVRVDERPRLELRWATPLIVTASMSLAAYELSLPVVERAALIHRLGVVPVELIATLDAIGATALAALRLFSALFVHADGWHLAGNMLFLLLFGMGVERVFRSRWCLMLFLLCGALANWVTALVFSQINAPIIGSSGAVSALIGAYLFLFPRAHLGVVLPLGVYFQFVRVPAQHLIGLWLLLQIVYTVATPNLSAVAWLAHVVGFLAGFVLAGLLRPWILRRQPVARLMD
jgi:membrane associated rhomboid family serine protease